MNLGEILLLKHKTLINEIKGQIVAVNKPNNPTENQAKYNIHPQDIVIEGTDGVRVTLQLTSKEMHLTPKEKGKLLTARSTPKDNGNGSDGVSVNVYEPPGKDRVFKVTVNKFASVVITELSGAPASAPAQTKVDGKKREDGGFIRLDLSDHVDALWGLTVSFNDKITGGAAVGDDWDLAQRLATTVYIQACRDGLIRPSGAPKVPEVEAKPEPKKPEPPMSREDAIGQVLTRSLTNQLKPDDDERLLYSCGAKWSDVYDALVEHMKVQGFTQSNIDYAHDEFRSMLARTAGMDEEKFYRSVCSDYDTFSEYTAGPPEMTAAAAQATQDEIQEDDIPV